MIDETIDVQWFALLQAETIVYIRRWRRHHIADGGGAWTVPDSTRV